MVAVYVTDINNWSAVLYGTYASMPNQVVLATITLPLRTIKYQPVLPPVSIVTGTTYVRALLVSATKFYVISS